VLSVDIHQQHINDSTVTSDQYEKITARVVNCEKIDKRTPRANAMHLILFGTPRPKTPHGDDRLEKECTILRSVTEEIKRISVELTFSSDI